MELVAEVKSPDPMNAPLASILRLPLGLDIWEVKATRIVLRANEAQLDRLRQMGFEVRQIVETEKHVAAFATDENIAGYHSVESLERDLRELAAKHSDIAELTQIGESIEHRPIWSIRIGARRADPALPKILFMGCHHAREWISVEVPFLLARELVTTANDRRVARWLNAGEIWIVPIVNPDGHEFSRTSNRL